MKETIKSLAFLWLAASVIFLCAAFVTKIWNEPKGGEILFNLSISLLLSTIANVLLNGYPDKR